MKPGQDYHIDGFRPGDLLEVLKIEQACFGDEAYPAALFRQFHRNAPDLFLVARHPWGVFGYCAASQHGEVGYIASIAVGPDWRRQGIAGALLKAEEAALRERGARLICLHVRQGNANAIALYARCGYTPLRVDEDYYEDGEAGVVMALRL